MLGLIHIREQLYGSHGYPLTIWWTIWYNILSCIMSQVFIYVYVCVPTCMYVCHVCIVPEVARRQCGIPMGLEFHAVVIHPTWVLGTEPGSSSARAVSAPSALPSLQLFSVLEALSQSTKWQSAQGSVCHGASELP